MKILIYALNFAPELVGCGKYNSELALDLKKRGHKIKVITAPPYYPDWKISKPFKALSYSKELWNRIPVIRCPIYVPKEPTGLKRLMHLLSFSTSSIFALFSTIHWKPDIIFCVAPTLFCAPGAILASKITGAKSWLHIQDFEVEAAFNLGILQNKFLATFALFCEKQILKSFNNCSTISDNMQLKLYKKGLSNEKAFLFPNWVDTQKIRPDNRCMDFRQKLGYKPSDIIVLYSGNLGQKQGVDTIINSAKALTAHREIKFLICGNGPEKKELLKSSKGLANVKFINFQPANDLNCLLNSADIHLLPQKSDATDLVMPSKLTGMLASGRATIATVKKNSQVSKVLKSCGICIQPENHRLLANTIKELSKNRKLRKTLGENARKYAVSNLDIKTIIDDFEKKILIKKHNKST